VAREKLRDRQEGWKTERHREIKK